VSALTIGVPRERAPGERRVALTPEVAGRLVAAGVDVVVEPGAGDGARLDDGAYVAAGARIGDAAWGCDVVVKVAAPTPVESTGSVPGRC
jgi:NAD(P) transhydrogenase subunit alpha